MNNPHVFIGIPSTTDWKADFGMSLAGMMAYSAQPLRDGRRIESLRLWNTKGSILSRSRSVLVKAARQTGMSHILMVDSDQTFPADTLHQLLAWDKKVVAANIATKVIPALPTARNYSPTKAAGELVFTDRGSKDLEKVWRIGTGIILLDLSIFDEIPEPWFPITWNDKTQDYTGEDWNFCQKLEDAKISIFIDHNLSKQVGHLGQYSYDHNVVGEVVREEL